MCKYVIIGYGNISLKGDNVKISNKSLLILLMVLVTVIVISCEINPNDGYDITFINRTEFTLTIAPFVSDHFDTFSISPDEKIVIKADRIELFLRFSGHSFLYSISATNSYRDRKTYIITQTKKQTYDINFINNTDFNLSISSKYQTYDDFIIKPEETKTIKSTSESLFYPKYDDEIGDYVIYHEMEGTTCTFSQSQTKNYDMTFFNDTDFDLTISDNNGKFSTFTIASNEIKIVKVNDAAISLQYFGDTGDYLIDKEQDSFKVTLYQYEYLIEYKITGTASSVSVTLNNAQGNTEQYNPVSVPHSYGYKSFLDDFLYISAQNQGSSGSVTVSIYKQGKLIETATSSGGYVIATASCSK